MSNLTSTLTLQLRDDGLQAKAKADAEAIKKLGASGADLKKRGEAERARALIGALTQDPQPAPVDQYLDPTGARATPAARLQ